eukprot:COSAG01_NODE_3370_length_6180_cov_29.608453_1_plen_98_part_00
MDRMHGQLSCFLGPSDLAKCIYGRQQQTAAAPPPTSRQTERHPDTPPAACCACWLSALGHAAARPRPSRRRPRLQKPGGTWVFNRGPIGGRVLRCSL